MAQENGNNHLKSFFEQTYGKELADKEVAEYQNRLTRFFSLLADIDRRLNVTKTYDQPNN